MSEDIQLVNRNGKIVGLDGDGNEVPVPVEMLDAEAAQITEPLHQIKRAANTRQLYHRRGELNDNFEDLSSWNAAFGNLSASASTVYSGSQSAKLTASSGNKVAIEKSVSLDLSDKDVSIVTRLDSPTDVGHRAEVVLYDSSGNYVIHKHRLIASQGWIVQNLGANGESSTSPDMTDISTIRVQIPEAGEDIEAYVDELRLQPQPDSGYCVITCDDGLERHYTEVFQETQKRGMVGVMTASKEWAESGETDGGETTLPSSDYEGGGRVHEMKDAGWLIGSETKGHTDLTTVSGDELHSELADNKIWLQEHGFENGAEYLTFPYGIANAEALHAAAQYHRLGRIVHMANNRPTITDTFHVMGESVDDSYVDNANHETDVDLAETYNQVCVFNFHDDTSQSNVATLLDYVEQSDLEVVTWEHLMNRQEALR